MMMLVYDVDYSTKSQEQENINETDHNRGMRSDYHLLAGRLRHDYRDNTTG